MRTTEAKRTSGPRTRTPSAPGVPIAATVRAAAGLVLIAILAACQPPPEPVRLGYFTWPGYEPLTLAADLGFYERPVRVVDYSSATQVLRAFRNGDIEIAALTLDETLLLAEDVPEVRVVLVLDVSHGADAILGRPGIARFEDLRRRRVGYEATALGAYMLARALEMHGMAAADVIPVAVQVDEHERAFREGRVDAIVTFEPHRSRLLAEGAEPLFDSSRIPNEIFDVLVTRAGFLERDPEAVADLVRGWFKGLRYLESDPEDAGKRLSNYLGLGARESLAVFARLPLQGPRENRDLLAGEPPRLAAVAERLRRFMVERDLLRAGTAAATLIDPRPLLATNP